jgi:predicted ATP-grasp superfamily ATP-dependent carboligase
VRVVITGGEKLAVLAAARALHAAGYATWAAASKPGSYTARSRAAAGIIHVPDAAVDARGFVAAVAEAAGDLGARAILPGTDKDLLAFADNRKLVPAHIAVGVPDPATVRTAIDKSKLFELASSAGLGAPPTVYFARNDAKAVSAELGFPLVVKPRTSESPRADGTLRHVSAIVVHHPEQLDAAIAKLPGKLWLAQPHLGGSLYAVCGLAWRGQVVCTEHQLASRIWPRMGGNSAYARTVPRDEELDAGVQTLIEMVEWEGIFQMQFIRRGEVSYLIDLNPRMYGSLSLAVAAGLNLPALWVSLLLGETPTMPEYRVGVRYREEENDVRALAWLLAHGRIRETLTGLLPHSSTVHAVFSPRDPGPVLTTLGKLFGLVGRRLRVSETWRPALL